MNALFIIGIEETNVHWYAELMGMKLKKLRSFH